MPERLVSSLKLDRASWIICLSDLALILSGDIGLKLVCFMETNCAGQYFPKLYD